MLEPFLTAFPKKHVCVYVSISDARFLREQTLNTTSWERPEMSADELTKSIRSEVEQSREEKSEEKSSTPLPADWTEVKDPNTGRVYFWNEVLFTNIMGFIFENPMSSEKLT